MAGARDPGAGGGPAECLGAATGPGAAGSSAQVPGPDARLPSETLEGDQLNCAECL